MDGERRTRRSDGAIRAAGGMVLAGVIVATLAARGWASGATVSVDPPEAVILGTTGAGETDVRIQEVENLYGYQLELHYDPAIVHAESIELGPFISPDWVLDQEIDNTTGVIALAVSQRHATPPRDGAGRLAQVRWRGESPGTSALTLMDVKLAEPGGVQIPVEVESGDIEVVPADAILELYMPLICARAVGR
jgi:hypothetical protein